MENDIKIAVARHDEQIKTLFRRLDAQDRLVENVNQLAISVEKLAINQESLTHSQNKIKEDVEEIKTQPAKDYRDLKKTIITAIITGLISIALGFLFGKFM